MPGTEVVRKQTVLGGAAGIALLAFALIYRFYPASGPGVPPPKTPEPAPAASAPAMTINPVVSPPAQPPPVPTPAAPAAEAPPTPAVPPTKAIATLLKKADKAFAEEHLLEPKDTSALALYQQVLALDKDNAAAQAGIDKIHKSLLLQANAALDRGDEKQAAQSIDAIASLQLPHAADELAALQSRRKVLQQVQPLLTRAADLLKLGHAIAPAGDSALDVYRQVLKLDLDNKLADQGLAQIERDYLDRALAAAAQDDFGGADQILDQASAIRPGSHELLDARTRIEGIRHQRAANTLAQANSALDANDPNLAELLAHKALGLSPDLAGVDDFNRRLRNARLYASLSPGQVIVDKFLDRSGSAPPLIVVPIGSFMMGSAQSEPGHRTSEEPQHEVRIESGFALGKDEVTVAEYRVFVDDSNHVTDAEKAGVSTVYDEESGRIIERHGVSWRDDYLGARADDSLPVIHISWNDAQAYAEWLAARTGKHYRLPSEAEFEYALRAGSTTRYPWGDGNPDKVYDNFTGDGDRSPRLKRSWAKSFPRYDDQFWGPAPKGRLPANPYSLHDMNGNVSEWVADCWHDNYTRAPIDGRAWLNPGCAAHVIRGGSWGSAPDEVRSAYRLAAPSDLRSPRVGMRVARDL
jgi:formylglycine-generating enzyme required for sulfatase activity